jgi:hypothetical protein
MYFENKNLHLPQNLFLSHKTETHPIVSRAKNYHIIIGTIFGSWKTLLSI